MSESIPFVYMHQGISAAEGAGHVVSSAKARGQLVAVVFILLDAGQARPLQELQGNTTLYSGPESNFQNTIYQVLGEIGFIGLLLFAAISMYYRYIYIISL